MYKVHFQQLYPPPPRKVDKSLSFLITGAADVTKILAWDDVTTFGTLTNQRARFEFRRITERTGWNSAECKAKYFVSDRNRSYYHKVAYGVDSKFV